ncbi:RHS repeat-associated core domain-containing protein [Stenotrophomonas sp. MH1]|uniref:RHS repeat-associated core domain-containing protein n=1 Tax=Stenotrophomonas capsici TaxID=3110230 RepID=A0ABU5V199_9GAMM|nr:RHS repeat-associated core domain-containing protein [Stenotrophomonas sp. MH1]MEA5667135.1 RHS repeat-associated core domain-containing protein [Stenotrophomonas sp. MH1]
MSKLRQQGLVWPLMCVGASLLLNVDLALGQSSTRTETITYHDNTTKWVLGQVASRSVNGAVAEQTTYDAVTAMPLQSWSFGKLKQTLTYNTDGTVATVKDGNNNVTTLAGWKRGIPQSITYADGKTQSAIVDDRGWIARVTDENGYATNYTYDAMGRMASIAYPTGDTVAWNSTTQAFVQVGTAEYGIPAGHWRQTVTTGNGVKISYFDALWRPLLVREYDSGNVTATQRFTGYEYDHEGRVVFTSYPSAASNPDKGIWTTYDALGRTKSVSQDSELGLLATTTAYLSDATGPYTLVTQPGGQQTRTWYQMFDQPSYDAPVKITHPEGAVTTIVRDVFGKPTSIVRGNSGGTVQATRTYTYNTNQELCRVVEPETGATLMGYDAGGNLTWSGSGFGATSACHATGQTAAILARTAARTYDVRNRLKTLTFPDGRGNQTWTYTADGLPNTVSADNDGANLVTTQYTYNRRRMLTEERMQWNQISWPINYTYNSNGHLSVEKYPNGQSVAFAPNALGQPTQAGTFATGVSYHPNGAIKQFTYGNGIVHTMTQNARHLPIRSMDCVVVGCTAAADKRLDLTYGFDKNANVSQITDNIAGRQNRSMVYDGLDRVTSTTSAMFGTATYAYDVLDNLIRVNVAGGGAARNHFYCYDTKWQLTNVKTGSCSGASVIGLGYDVQGNLNNKNGKVFDFDFGNRLRGVNGIASYVYDAAGRRVRDYTTASKYSLYAQDGRLMYSTDGRLGVSTQYVYLGGSLVAFREAVGTVITPKYQHTDALGSPITVTGADKAVLERNEYEPYGQVVNATAKDGPGFTGHVLDAATGMNYMQQRYYDPQIGRFLSVDPVTAYKNPVGAFNRYWYANNNPYRFTDPDGRYACTNNGATCSVRDARLTDSFVKAAAATHGKMRDGSAKTQLGKVLDIIGTAGDGNGFTINLASLGEGVLGQFSKGGMDLDAQQIRGTASRTGLRTDVVGGMVVGHEGVHKWDSMQPGARPSYFPATGIERMVTELNAYGMSSAMANALGIRNAYNQPGMSLADRRRAIWDGAKRSWEGACASGGGGCSGYEP